MNEFYTEQLVKQNATLAASLKKAGLVLATIITVYLAFLSPFMLVLPIIMIVVDYFVFKRMDLEYEYTYYNGDLDIDRIKGKQTRKRMLEINVKDIEVLAPTGSIELQPYQQLKTYNFSSNSGNRTYEMVICQKGMKVKVIFEPNATILESMKLLEPRKIFI